MMTVLLTESLIKLGQAFLNIFIESAWWLLLGFFMAGVIKSFIPQQFLQKHLGGNDVWAVIKGALFGAPLPLCSCGVIPAALGLHRAGASKAATTSFLIATPETGVDSISVTYALLGPFMAIIRPIAAVSTAITAGLVVLFADKNADNSTVLAENSQTTISESSCCNSEKPAIKKQEEATQSCCDNTNKVAEPTTSCCDKTTASTIITPKKETVLDKLVAGFKFSFIDLLKDISLWLLIGLGLAAVIMAFVPASLLATWGASPYAYVLMALIGVPMYICATSSTPIAAGLLFAGVSPGAILVFLLVGPATNMATLSVVKQELGKRTLVIYLSVITLLGFLFGGLTDWLAKRFDIQVLSHVNPEHVHTSPLAIVSAVVLAMLLIYALWQKYLVK